MNSINQHNKIDRNTKFWFWQGYYDYYEEYCEEFAREVTLGDLREDKIEAVSFGHDITIFIAPHFRVVVFAKKAHDLDRYKVFVGEDYIKNLLGESYREDMPDEGCFWETYDFPASI